MLAQEQCFLSLRHLKRKLTITIQDKIQCKQVDECSFLRVGWKDHKWLWETLNEETLKHISVRRERLPTNRSGILGKPEVKGQMCGSVLKESRCYCNRIIIIAQVQNNSCWFWSGVSSEDSLYFFNKELHVFENRGEKKRLPKSHNCYMTKSNMEIIKQYHIYGVTSPWWVCNVWAAEKLTLAPQAQH